jgi:hypothetical protein
MNSVKAKLVDAATRDEGPPPCYKEKVEKHLFEWMSAYFAFEIKNNHVVRNIFEGQLLAQVDVRLQGQQLTVERIETSLRDVAKAVPQVIEKLDRIEAAIKEAQGAMDAERRLKRNAFLLGWDLFFILSPNCTDLRATAEEIKARLQALEVEVEYPDPVTQHQDYFRTLHLTVNSIFAQIRAKHGEEILRYFVLSVNTLITLGKPNEPVSFLGISHALELATISEGLQRELDELRGRYERGEILDTERGPLFSWANKVHDYFMQM